jgi:hypothetical protein
MAKSWFYARDGHTAGPFSSTELQRLAASGVLLPTDLVSHDGSSGWVPAKVVKGLFSRSNRGTLQPPTVASTEERTELDWYYSKNGQSCGPFSLEQLKQLIASGVLTRDDWVRQKGEDTWQAVWAVKVLTQVSPPAPQQRRRMASPSLPVTAREPGVVEPPQDSLVEDGWYYSKGSLTEGPVLFIRLQQLVTEGVLGPTDLVLPPGNSWVAVRDVKALAASTATRVAPRTRDQDLVLELYDLLKSHPMYVDWYLAPGGGIYPPLKASLSRWGAAWFIILVLVSLTGVGLAISGPLGIWTFCQIYLDRAAYKKWRDRVNALVTLVGYDRGQDLIQRVPKMTTFQQFWAYATQAWSMGKKAEHRPQQQ